MAGIPFNNSFQKFSQCVTQSVNAFRNTMIMKHKLTVDTMGQEVESCVCPQGSQMTHLLSGGTGWAIQTLSLIKSERIIFVQIELQQHFQNIHHPKYRIL